MITVYILQLRISSLRVTYHTVVDYQCEQTCLTWFVCLFALVSVLEILKNTTIAIFSIFK